MNNREEIITWLVSNKPLIVDVVERVMGRRIESHSVFYEEAQEQFDDEVKKEVVDQLTKDLGCTMEDFYEIIGDAVLSKYVEEVIK